MLSRESLRRFHDAHQDSQSACVKDGGDEDLEVANCLRTKGVRPGKSVDAQNRELFHPLPFIAHFRGLFPDWLPAYAENTPQSVSAHSMSVVAHDVRDMCDLSCRVTTVAAIKVSLSIMSVRMNNI